MNAEAVLAAYPNARVAIAYVEVIICVPPKPGEEPAWDMVLRENPGVTPRQMAEALRIVLKDEAAARAQEAREQMLHPEFLAYLKGKMGCM